MIKHHIRKIIALPAVRQARLWLRRVGGGEHGARDVPYWCQFATPQNTRDILDGKMKPADDLNWQVFGYDTPEESAYWMPRQCGVVCVKMILQARGDNASVAELTSEGLALGAYDRAADKGWYYKPLVGLLKKHGVNATIWAHLPVNVLAMHVANERPVIASVNPQIIRGDTHVTNHKKSGHLVIVKGVRVSHGEISGFVIHNPSGKSDDMRANAFIPLAQFNQAYGEKGIMII